MHKKRLTPETKYRIIAENTYNWEFWRDPDGQFIFSSPACQRMTGHTPQEFAEDSGLLLRIIHDKDLNKFIAHGREVTQPPQPGELEFRILHTDGSVHWIAHTCQPVFDDQGVYLGIRGSNRDITPRKEVEATLRESEGQIRLLYENSEDAILFTIPDGHILAANPAACRMFGRTEEEIKQAGRNGLVDPNDPRLPALLEERRLTGKAKGELIQIRKDGSKFPAEVSSAVFKDREGQLRTGLILRDITERKQAEEALRKSERQWRSLVETIPDYVALYDRDDKYIFLNHYAEGYSEKDIAGKSYSDFLPEEARIAYDEAFEKAHLTGETQFLEYVAPGDGGIQRYYDSYIVPIFEEGQLVNTLVLARDITERKRAEQTLRESEEKYRGLFENSVMGISLASPEGRLLTANPAYAKMYGYPSPAEMIKEVNNIGQQLYANPEDRQKVLKIIAKNGFMSARKFRVVRRNKTHFWVSTSAWPVRDADGNLLYYGSSNEDITDNQAAEEELKQRSEQLVFLNNLGRIVNQSLSVGEVTSAVLKGIVEAVQADRVLLFLREGERLVLQGLHSPHNHLKEDEIPEHCVGECLCGLAVQKSSTLYSRNVYADLRCTWKECKDAGLTSFVALPLHSDKEIIGVIGLAFEKEHALEPQLKFLETIAGQVSTGLRNALLHEQVAAGQEQMRKLASYLQLARENERAFISRELHDEIGQNLTGLKMILEIAPRLEPTQAAQHIQQAQELVSELIGRVSQMSLNLHPAMLDDLGLLPALSWLINRYMEQTHIRVDFKHQGGVEERFSTEIETALYRIVQEALTNVARHSAARQVKIHLKIHKTSILLLIEDRGQGFELKEVMSGGSAFGLAGMRERAALLGGSLEIVSAAGQGTRLQVEIPLKLRKETNA